MAGETLKKGPVDRTRIDISNADELKYWAQQFAVSEEQVREAVQKVGIRVDDVQKALGM